ncbi:MAG: signal peptidase I [bacterium]|nr:signal peptidase I [bacterium]
MEKSKELTNVEKSETKKKGLGYELASYAIWIGAAVVVALAIRAFVFEKVSIQGDSMNPTFLNKQQCFIEKVSYRFHDANRFDVVVLTPPPGEEHDHFIKRIIGLPGETVQIIDGFVYINGEKLDDPYGKTATETAGIAADPVKLGENEYFVMGDNRDYSRDSRSIGPVKSEKINGRVLVRVWPIKDFKVF